MSASACSWTREAKAASISFSVPAFRIWSCTPFARAASCTSRDDALGNRVVRVHEQGDHAGLGNQFGKQLESLGIQLGGEHAHAREVATGSGETGDEACRDRVVAADEDDRDCRGCAFRRQRRRGAATRRDHVDLAADEVGRQCGQPIIVALGPPVFDRHVLSLDIAGFAQSLPERGHKRCIRAGRGAAEKSDYVNI